MGFFDLIGIGFKLLTWYFKWKGDTDDRTKKMLELAIFLQDDGLMPKKQADEFEKQKNEIEEELRKEIKN